MTLKLRNSKNLIQQYLTESGDGQGVYKLVGNYATPTTFKYKPPKGYIGKIAGVTVFLSAVGAFAFDQYVPGSALSNGLYFKHHDPNDSDKIRLPYRESVLTLGEYAIFGEGSSTDFNQGNAINYAIIDLPFFSLFGDFIDINGDNEEEFQLILNDSFVGLNDHIFLIHGRLDSIS